MAAYKEESLQGQQQDYVQQPKRMRKDKDKKFYIGERQFHGTDTLSDLYEALALFLAEGPEKDVRSALGDMQAEVAHIHDFAESTLVIVPDNLCEGVRECFVVAEIVCHEGPGIMPALACKRWSKTNAFAQFRLVISDLHKAGSLEAYALIRDYIWKEVNET